MELDKNLNKLASLLLAKSIKDLFPDVVLCESNSTIEGFGYGFKFVGDNVSSNDFNKIKKQMKKNIDSAFSINYFYLKKFELLNIFKDNKYKLEIINSINNEDISVCKIGDSFIDLCEDLKITKLSLIKAYELLNVSGYYWKNSLQNDQLILINGICFDSNEKLEQYKKELIERNESDHRKIGKDLEIFTFNNIIGQGLPIWLPNGHAIKYEIENYIFQILKLNNYHLVSSPVLGSKKLYEISGHWDHYRENMFSPVEIDDETLVLRPMTCPHHLTIYKSFPKSYRDLPYRIGELATLHRYEASGGLIGLERVRQLQLIDTHVICSQKQIKSEIKIAYEMIKNIYKTFNTKIYSIDLSLHDPKNTKKFFDNEKMWKNAETQLKSALKTLKISYREMIGEAAFYGPKIDFQVKTNLGKIITVSTIQLDFLLPSRFELSYKNYDGNLETPILIHVGTIGTLERFISILLEQTKGILPLWLSPNQVDIILVNNEKHRKYGEKIAKQLIKNGIRVKVDNSDERISKKIRNAQIHKVPYQIIIGDNEIIEKNISYREYGKQDSFKVLISNFIKILKKRIKNKN